MQAKQQIISRTENNEQISEFIKKRNDNFKNSSTKMIDSCLERNRKAIILDRIMIHADTPKQHLELIPDEIKKQTALHFQKIADSTNRDVST
ncbi:11745_t:CDS:1, partial [Funneliformis geosporum]